MFRFSVSSPIRQWLLTNQEHAQIERGYLVPLALLPDTIYVFDGDDAAAEIVGVNVCSVPILLKSYC